MRKVIVKETRTNVLLVDDLIPVKAVGSLQVNTENGSRFDVIQSRGDGILGGIGFWLPGCIPTGSRWEVVEDDCGKQCLVLVKEGR